MCKLSGIEPPAALQAWQDVRLNLPPQWLSEDPWDSCCHEAQTISAFNRCHSRRVYDNHIHSEMYNRLDLNYCGHILQYALHLLQHMNCFSLCYRLFGVYVNHPSVCVQIESQHFLCHLDTEWAE